MTPTAPTDPTIHSFTHHGIHQSLPSQDHHSLAKTHHPDESNTMNNEGNKVISYFKSSKHDKISDYEDIWEKSPVPPLDQEREGTSMISPTISEQRFKQFLFNKVFDKNNSSESHYETETDDDEVLFVSDPSYPTCSSSEIISSSDESSSISSFSTQISSSDDNIDDDVDTSDVSDPLAALEILSDCDTEDDIDDCYIASEDNTFDKDQMKVIEVSHQNTDKEYSSNTENSFENEKEGVEICNALENVKEEEESGKISSSGSLTGLLRKLSIRRKQSFTKTKSKTEKRLSAVIGCYLTPTLLGMEADDCQVNFVLLLTIVMLRFVRSRLLSL